MKKFLGFVVTGFVCPIVILIALCKLVPRFGPEGIVGVMTGFYLAAITQMLWRTIAYGRRTRWDDLDWPKGRAALATGYTFFAPVFISGLLLGIPLEEELSEAQSITAQVLSGLCLGTVHAILLLVVLGVIVKFQLPPHEEKVKTA